MVMMMVMTMVMVVMVAALVVVVMKMQESGMRIANGHCSLWLWLQTGRPLQSAIVLAADSAHRTLQRLSHVFLRSRALRCLYTSSQAC